MRHGTWHLVSGTQPATGAAMTALLAESLAVDFEERILLIGPVAPSALDHPNLVRRALPNDHDVAAGVRRVVARLGGHDAFHRILVDPGTRARHAAVLPAIGHLIQCANDTFAALPSEVSPGARVSFVGQLSPDHSHYEPHLFRAGTCRATVPLDQLAGKARRDTLRPGQRRFIDRLARTIGGRRVGLALGGGGAWGFGHVALIEALVDAEIPIDVISGVSFGAIVGALYSSGGLPALERMVADRHLLMGAIWASTFHSRALEGWVEKRVPQRWLERLPLPFVPVATAVGTGEPDALRVGAVGRAVRASGSLPGLLGPTIIGGTRYVDGGISCNVPANLLPAEGAGLVIASNMMQRPTAERRPANRRAPRLQRFVAEMNPLERAKDLILSMSTLTHNGGALTAVNAHVTYQAHSSKFSPWDFHKGDAIRAEARADVADTITRVEHAWASLSQAEAGR